MAKISYKRHLAKTITWRILGTLDTICISWIITGNPLTGLKIGFAEVFTKMVLYYFHERLWIRVPIPESRKRHLTKTFSWRFIGTVDTILLSWLISGNPIVGLKIGGFEVISKMILYYLHERIWYRLNFGLIKGRLNNIKIKTASTLKKQKIKSISNEDLVETSNFGHKVGKSISTNIVPHSYMITKKDRQKRNGHNSFLIFLTGLSGSGKSIIANALEEMLHK